MQSLISFNLLFGAPIGKDNLNSFVILSYSSLLFLSQFLVGQNYPILIAQSYYTHIFYSLNYLLFFLKNFKLPPWTPTICNCSAYLILSNITLQFLKRFCPKHVSFLSFFNFFSLCVLQFLRSIIAFATKNTMHHQMIQIRRSKMFIHIIFISNTELL